LLHTNGKIYGLTAHGGSHVSDGVIYSLDASLKPFVAPVVLHSGKVGTSVGVLGQGFNNATGVLFGTGAGTFTLVSDTFVTAKLAAGATTGLITVKEPTGNLLSQQNFRVVPSITSFSPTSGPAGTQVVITGMSLSQATLVRFGTVKATAFTVNSDTKVTTTVPAGAVSGKISITTAGGTATSSAVFTVN
jgi:IPT/TIG domain